MTKLSHIDLNVSNYALSLRFYDLILLPLGWKRLVCQTTFTTYGDDNMKICICPTESKYLSDGFHRKRIGLNHLAFYASTKNEVDDFHKNVLVKNNIKCLYDQSPQGDDSYYAVYFEDPDRIKIEVVYSLDYCKPEHWTNTLESNFDPYEK